MTKEAAVYKKKHLIWTIIMTWTYMKNYSILNYIEESFILNGNSKLRNL